MAVLYQQPNSRPPESMTPVQNTWILRSLQRLGLLFAFHLSPLLCHKITHGHILQSALLFFSKAGLSEDGLRLLITHKCSCLTSCDVCYRAVLSVKKKSLQLPDRPVSENSSSRFSACLQRWNILGVFSKSDCIYTRPTNQRLGVSVMALSTAVETSRTFMSVTIG